MYYLSSPKMEKEESTFEGHEFYTAAVKYWEHVPPTIDGMLGGFGFISQIDIKGSTKFLKALFEVYIIMINFVIFKILIFKFFKYYDT